ncbi:hypothetical protein L228DRAFT_242342 [Xylona heveae TC161]|uniref:Dynactin subunit n=1 Tax=Xylona heveae (strain CBS 132557 / TC161) TaxID=1328760 RepID=A0A165JA02_XYLHT|nr:hypothetical protein L228DRAFT_242342 [Xylona heveae TC161]KZF25954.1 hypothetical protein L228DRAFT_242342 [Xylona heveae TC161]
MALSRKYAGLPDLDLAPDVYETPALTEGSTHPTSDTARSDSDSGDEAEAIDRARLRLDNARLQFEPARIDARDVDFSDRIALKRKSYRASSRRQRGGPDGGDDDDDDAYSDEEESLERKLARLRREVEEVRLDMQNKQAEQVGEKEISAEDEGPSQDSPEQDINELCNILDDLEATGRNGGKSIGPEARLLQALKSRIPSADAALAREPPPAPAAPTDPTLERTHALTRVADFETRLAALEQALGLATSLTGGVDDPFNSPPVLPTLDRLDRQLSALLQSSPASLEAVSRRVRDLARDAEKLEELTKRANTSSAAASAATFSGYSASEEQLPSSSSTQHDAAPLAGYTGGEEDATAAASSSPSKFASEQVAKINALYGTLPSIQSMAPVLPSLLNRLRSLQVIHERAGSAVSDLDELERSQADMQTDLKKWAEGLDRIEEAMFKAETTTGGNVEVVEGWVRGLEERMKCLGV